MFRSARLKLTAWYLSIIMVVSMAFSIAIYRDLTFELDRVQRVQRARIERQLLGLSRPLPLFSAGGTQSPTLILDPDLVQETKNRLKLILILIDSVVLGVSAGAGYFLAGRTLRPIKEMIDEQDRFISDASHELRTPLTSLKSEIEVNLRDTKITLRQAKNLLKSNLEDVNNLQTLSDGLIKLTHHRQNNGLAVSKVTLVPLVEEAVRRVSPLAKKKNISIERRLGSEVIEANKTSLTELFVIFLDNAIKYSQARTKILVSSHRSDGEIVIQVIDQGMGIGKEDLPHLFDRFYRADKSRTKSEVSGYGLGLSIAKQIVESHYGSIVVSSQPGQGTTFTVQLPLVHQKRLVPSFGSFQHFLSQAS